MADEHRCTACNMDFQTKEQLERHEKDVHGKR